METGGVSFFFFFFGVNSHFWEIIHEIFRGAESGWFNRILDSDRCRHRIEFYSNKKKKNTCEPELTSFLSPIPFLMRRLPGYLSPDCRIESRNLSYILAH